MERKACPSGPPAWVARCCKWCHQHDDAQPDTLLPTQNLQVQQTQRRYLTKQQGQKTTGWNYRSGNKHWRIFPDFQHVVCRLQDPPWKRKHASFPNSQPQSYCRPAVWTKHILGYASSDALHQALGPGIKPTLTHTHVSWQQAGREAPPCSAHSVSRTHASPHRCLPSTITSASWAAPIY